MTDKEYKEYLENGANNNLEMINRDFIDYGEVYPSTVKTCEFLLVDLLEIIKVDYPEKYKQLVNDIKNRFNGWVV